MLFIKLKIIISKFFQIHDENINKVLTLNVVAKKTLNICFRWSQKNEFFDQILPLDKILLPKKSKVTDGSTNKKRAYKTEK